MGNVCSKIRKFLIQKQLKIKNNQFERPPKKLEQLILTTRITLRALKSENKNEKHEEKNRKIITKTI